MSEESPASIAEQDVAASAPQSGAGDALRAAREQRGLELGDAARQLRMSSRQVAALEAGDFAALPSPAFTRGFIRNYARLLEIDPEPLLAAYQSLLPENVAGASTISLHSEEIPILTGARKTWMPYLAASLVLGVAMGGWWAYMDWREKELAAPAVVVAAPEPVTVQPEPLQPPVQIVEVPPSDPAVVPQEGVLPAPPAETPGTPEQLQAAATVSGNRITMKFTQQSWVRVTDKDGHEIFHKNKPENTEDSVEGNPPFRLEIGNASGVQLNYRDQLVDLAPHTKANVARLTLE